MKRILALVIIVFIIASIMPAFAEGQSTTGKKSVFQEMNDAIKGFKITSTDKGQSEKRSIFQRMADGIKEGSVKAKDNTLR